LLVRQVTVHSDAVVDIVNQFSIPRFGHPVLDCLLAQFFEGVAKLLTHLLKGFAQLADFVG